ncbi:16S rRNA (adenine(1518)-N(6)/adenine(1519)-N(6))-dimethyltransferase RsmA [Methylobacillus flagellatus]|uniref:16S rRNA (adenine(1518)-N(6)/adenine(1519)-N(6))- dimethyltransferase RsmA n=1 Tax=Methylobacillus flagellatus TaxID=405 RepID=UPI002853F9FA|nr:16S rRNA (adenine(1518)-N(6)/adenine(1519)-N(6))-dimethyltransferase RsmA [Methylobacillus flagellatus]MDR5172452.1 16S rRNA (adenine(1518)-N(6)/adenine(1519)-N(6))-dimethyltransferase RsmA [Methylobacillus flagellatus]
MKHVAKKRFGQNFLTDRAIINSLIEAISPQAGDCMVEIGPGLGAMTQPLLQRLPHLHVVEIDRDIIEWMQGHYPQGKLTIHASDALKFDFGSINDRLRVVGNLPYNISTPILFHLLDNVPHIIDMHFMLQKEVVERMVAAPSSAAYGRLSVMLQYRLQMEYLLTVPPEAFDPAPKVESAFVRAVPYAALPYPARDEALFAKVVTAAFSQRRKTLRNTLKGMLDDAGFAALGIDPQLRAENISPAEFVAIANHLAA